MPQDERKTGRKNVVAAVSIFSAAVLLSVQSLSAATCTGGEYLGDPGNFPGDHL